MNISLFIPSLCDSGNQSMWDGKEWNWWEAGNRKAQHMKDI